jgi:hypothetical protein
VYRVVVNRLNSTTVTRVLAVNTPESLMLSGSLVALSDSTPTSINIYESVTFIGAKLNNYVSYNFNPDDLRG